MYTREQFIAEIAPLAIASMKKTNIPVSVIIAQAVLESANGNSELAQKANNLFGIKGNGNAGNYEIETVEYIDYKPTIVKARFRKYNSWEDSIEDHSRLIMFGVSWNSTLYHGAIGVDGITASKEIAKAGYATDPNYAQKLIDLINSYGLLYHDIGIIPDDIAADYPIDFQIQHLLSELNEMTTKLNKLIDNTKPIPAPEWFTTEFPEALQLLSDQTGSYEFWRSYAVTLRTVKQHIKKAFANYVD